MIEDPRPDCGHTLEADGHDPAPTKWRKDTRRHAGGWWQCTAMLRADRARAALIRRPQRAYNRGRRRRHTEAIQAIKLERGCMDCDGDFPPEGLHFDHVPERGPKRFAIHAGAGYAPDTLAAEIAKCDVVCASCHLKRGHARGQIGA